jgi:hypothetical protein
VRVFFFSTEEVANLGDAFLWVWSKGLPKKGDNARPRAPCARSSRFFVFSVTCAVSKRLFRQGAPIPNGFFGKARRHQTAFSARCAVTKRLFRQGAPIPNGFFGKARRHQTAFSARCAVTKRLFRQGAPSANGELFDHALSRPK